MGVYIITFYSIIIPFETEDERVDDREGHTRTTEEKFKMAITFVTLALGATEFVIGVWAAICCCLMRPCACCSLVPRVVQHPNPEAHQVAYTADPAVYVMTQAPGGVPVGAGGGKTAVYASGAQEVHSPMVLEPLSGALRDSSEKLRGDCKLGGIKSENKYQHTSWL